MEKDIGFQPFLGRPDPPPTREEFEQLKEAYFQLERTVYGLQQMLGKAAEYKGKPRGKLPR